LAIRATVLPGSLNFGGPDARRQYDNIGPWLTYVFIHPAYRCHILSAAAPPWVLWLTLLQHYCYGDHFCSDELCVTLPRSNEIN
jgi:hypothetical protein